MQNNSISIEVCYALPRRQELVNLHLQLGATVGQAVSASGLLQKYPELDLAVNKLGIYGKLTSSEAVLRNRDRIEIYRPLIADPKEARRQRAKKKGN